MAKADKTDQDRLAQAIEAYRSIMDSPNPMATFEISMSATRCKALGDPFNASMERFAEFVMRNPDELRGTDSGEVLRRYLGATAQQVKAMLADKLDKPSLNDPRMLSIEIDDDWRINAFVEEEAPHSIYVSMNLFLFCARVSDLLFGGMDLDVTGDDGAVTYSAAAPYSINEVARGIKKILESFSIDQSIARTATRLKAAHFVNHQIVFHSLMALIICHEFGHVTINAMRQAAEPVPFSDRAHYELEADIEPLIHSGRHDPKDMAGLRKLGAPGLRAVLANWENEITADLIGVSLATEYICKRGPWRNMPDVQAVAYLAFHLGLMAQFLLHVFLNKRRESFLLLSKSHPPIDFRTHCVLKWMYGCPAVQGRAEVSYGEHPAYKAVARYGGEILSQIFSGAERI